MIRFLSNADDLTEVTRWLQIAFSAVCIVGSAVELALGNVWAAIWPAFVLACHWACFRRVPIVRLSDDQLEVSRGSVVARMDVSNVRSVLWQPRLGLDIIFVSLRSPASFGDSFWFVAKTRTLLLGDMLFATTPHPIVATLQTLAREANAGHEYLPDNPTISRAMRKWATYARACRETRFVKPNELFAKDGLYLRM